ncbi:MAG: hypothetical protein WCO44_03940 [Bacteroidota bacterium]
MRRFLKITGLILVLWIVALQNGYSVGPLDPVKLGSWSMNIGIGPGNAFFGNGQGFGFAEKVSVEKGMWDAGPGIVTLGGEVTSSAFRYNFGDGWNESWANFFFAARSAYHYGWDVEGLDTYGGIPLGIGFTVHSVDNHPGSHGYTPVYPYFGVFFGASWFFTKKIGVNGEVGYNSTHANLGVIIKLN